MNEHSFKNEFIDKGYFEIEDFFSENQFDILKTFVNEKIYENNDKSFFLTSNTNSELDLFFEKNLIIKNKIQTIIKQFNYVKEDDESYEVYKCLRVIKNSRIKKLK